MRLDFFRESTWEFEKRLSFCLVVTIGFFVIVFFRLFYLQIIKGNYFWVFSNEHTIKEIRLPATRGVIFDRDRLSLVENRPSFDLALVPQHLRDVERVKKSLYQLINLDPIVIEKKWNEIKRSPPYYPFVLQSDIPYEEAVKIRVAKSVESANPLPDDTIDLRGVEVLARPLRSYPQGPVASALIGYVGELSEKDLAKYQKDQPGRYVLGDSAGAAGLEKYGESFLKGQDGFDNKIIDAVGREVPHNEFSSFLKGEEAHHGNNLVLTIDGPLQKFAEERFQGKTGSLVAVDPNTGDILAMVSLPSFDPTKLVANISHDYWATLVTDPRHLLLNRAIQGTYPPGSTFKIVTSIAALEEGVIKPDETLSCRGGLNYGGRLFHCWRKGGHGAISIRRAIAESCDTFYYQMGLRLGVDRIAKYAKMLGLGQKTGIELEGEKGGTIPSSEWKLKYFKEPWQPGENLSIAVGQGYDTETPLQNAMMVAQVATGLKIRPRLFKTIENEDGENIREGKEILPEKLPISEATLAIVREGMAGVTLPGGTAQGSHSQWVTMAGKTGTAQVISEEGKSRTLGSHAQGMNTGDHAWFVVYAPVEKPQIAVAVLVEHGGFGASAAAPIAKDVIEKYLKVGGVKNEN